MMVSTKGRYALQVCLDLAQQDPEAYISLREVAQRQNISMKYLESIVAMLNRAGLVRSLRGKGGGYRLNRKPEDCSVAEILQLTEGSLADLREGGQLHHLSHVAPIGPAHRRLSAAGDPDRPVGGWISQGDYNSY